jgi:hypothetical protein
MVFLGAAIPKELDDIRVIALAQALHEKNFFSEVSLVITLRTVNFASENVTSVLVPHLNGC